MSQYIFCRIHFHCLSCMTIRAVVIFALHIAHFLGLHTCLQPRLLCAQIPTGSCIEAQCCLKPVYYLLFFNSSICWCVFSFNLFMVIIIQIKRFNFRFLLFLVFMLLSSGCIHVGPKYSTRSFPMPDAWHTQLTESLVQGESNIETWWTNFQDPLLDKLILRAKNNN